MSSDKAAALAAVDTHFDEFVAELQQLCRIRSRRQEPDQMAAAADFLAGSVARWGGTAQVLPWPQSHPYVLAEMPGGPRRLLNFNHYDVEIEPAGEESDWTAPPYAARITNGRLYARGVADDKAALLARIHAAAAWRLSGQDAPVTSRYLMEGKQSLHSPGLASFVAAHREQIAADAVLWENSWIDSQGRLLLKLAEKGVLYLRLTARTLTRELTSQNTALLPAATTRLIAALASLQDPDGDCVVPGFADGAREPTDAERTLLAALPFDVSYLKARAGIDAFRHDEDAVAAAQAIRIHPTMTIASIAGGDSTDDVTLGVPATATAKIEIRLVAGQSPQTVLAAVERHLATGGFDDVAVEVMATSQPNRTDHTNPFVVLVADAAREAYGTEPVVEPYTPWIGNQGVLSGMPIVGIGVSRADANIDGPDEHVWLEDYRTGIKHVVTIMAAMATKATKAEDAP